MKRPHIIFLMSDQQRWDTLGSVDPIVQTPHLDALCRDGIRFEQAVCQAPMCVPSRCSMMQGLYASQCGVRNNGQSISHDSQLQNKPLVQVLKDRGYRTWGFGKTHWHDGRFANVPTTRGLIKSAGAS